MNILEAIILGFLQGITEFIPVSSTAHVTIGGHILGLIQNSQRWTSFLAVIQLGTLIAIVIYFFKDILIIIRSFFSENFSKKRKRFVEQSVNAKLGTYVIISSIPIVVVALIFENLIEGDGTKNLLVIAISLIVIALALLVAEKKSKHFKNIEDIGIKESIIIGFAQCLALIPGASRSGSTIMASMYLGMKREVAARFSFLISIPAIFGSGIYSLVKSLDYILNNDLEMLVVSVIVSAIIGYLSIAFLLNYLKNRTTMIFIFYRIILGSVIIALIIFNVI